MDDLDRLQAIEDERFEHEEARRSLDFGSPRTTLADDAPTKHSITIFGCIKTETGWYRLGFDEATKTMIPLEKVP